MELLNQAFVESLLTAFSVCLSITVLSCIPSIFRGFRTDAIWHFVVAAVAFSMLGYVTGNTMSNSREPAVAAVLPAVLTLMGGVGAFLIGSKGLRNQIVVAALIFDFSLALFIGGFSGAELRVQDDLSIDNALAREEVRHAVDLRRLLNYVDLLKSKHEFEDQDKIDLSRFHSIFEQPIEGKDKDPK
jgi:hypothetical protein